MLEVLTLCSSDPDRPKNDKATILGESIQVVKELRDEVKRLKTEHSSLLDESTDVCSIFVFIDMHSHTFILMCFL